MKGKAMYYKEHEDHQDHRCHNCDAAESNKENMQEFLKSIMEQLYSAEPLNVAKLEDDLDNLCFQMNMEIMPGEMQVQRLEKPSFLNSWMQYNQEQFQIAMGE